MKTAVIYDTAEDTQRVDLITAKLEKNGYNVHRFDQQQGLDMLQFIRENRPTLVLSSSMKTRSVTGLEALDAATQSGSAAIMFSMNTGHGARPDELAELNESCRQANLPEAQLYLSPTYSDFSGLMKVVIDAVKAATPLQSSGRSIGDIISRCAGQASFSERSR